jgi:hypothetical protein
MYQSCPLIVQPAYCLGFKISGAWRLDSVPGPQWRGSHIATHQGPNNEVPMYSDHKERISALTHSLGNCFMVME